MLITRDFNASLRCGGLALAISLGADGKPCKFRREDCLGFRRDFIVSCPTACFCHYKVVHSIIFQYLPVSVLVGGRPILLALRWVCQLVWPACWIDTPDMSSSSGARVVQDA